MAARFVHAQPHDLQEIWQIIQHAIARRKADGSNQWQDGYPNPDVLSVDISKHQGFVLREEHIIIGYVAVMINDEPQYDEIDGEWMTTDDFVVYHRVAIAPEFIGQGYAKKLIQGIHDYALEKGIKSVKADTNFDNQPMINIFEKLGYQYCGGVMINGSPRRAYEKILT
jgi:GNAT superfamily N-acetyltransferase